MSQFVSYAAKRVAGDKATNFAKQFEPDVCDVYLTEGPSVRVL